jgi:putative FmdB family regulatory protein
MPTYDYHCEECDHHFEKFQSITARKLTRCPRCGGKIKRLIGTGAGILFKGTGFYETDYRSKSYREGEKRAKEIAKPPVEKVSAEKKPAEKKAASVPAKD